MTIDERKLELIEWITKLEDETVIYQIETFKKASLDALPAEIVSLLERSDSEDAQQTTTHTSAKTLLNK